MKARHAGGATTHPKPSRLISSGRIKTDPTGDSQLDRYCDDIASDVNAALDREKAQRDAGNTAAADSWHEYANRLLKTARSRGCGFVKARHVRNDAGRPDVDTSKHTTSDPTPTQTDKAPQTGPSGDPQVQS